MPKSTATCNAILALIFNATAWADIAENDTSSPLSNEGEATATATALGTLAAAIVVTGDVLNSANVADAVLDAADAIETGLTMRQALRLIAAAVGGKVSGGGTTTITFRNAVADDTDRIVATVDNDGNRTAIAIDLD